MNKYKVIQVKTKRGFVLNAFEQDSITREIQERGEYDANTLDSIDDILRIIKPEVSLDIGANIGNHSLVIARNSRRLVAFEPVGFIFGVLQSNLLQNRIDHAQAVNSGLSDEAADRDIFIPENGNLGSSSIEARDGAGCRLRINTIIGDGYVQKNLDGSRIDFIKIDVEGHEASALQGLRATIKESQPLLLLEWNNATTVNAFSNKNLFAELFSGYGYYSLSYTSNKKMHARNLAGFIKRLYYRSFAKRWCLSDFEPSRHYSNVYFVPPRYKAVFEQFIYFSPKGVAAS